MRPDSRLTQLKNGGHGRRARLISYRCWCRLARTAHPAGAIVNADDWGESPFTTQRILDCANAGSVSAVSAMVFMEDAERAADLARAHGIDAGLHLNLTTRFSGGGLPGSLAVHHERVASYLGASRIAQYLYHPGLAGSFAYVIRAQWEEFERLYGSPPERVDGHHHMHLSANVMAAKLLPRGLVIRRNFTFLPGEKSPVNRTARRLYDSWLSRGYRMVDALAALPPVEPHARLLALFSRACRESVEIETHPVQQHEYAFLMGGGLFRFAERIVED